MPIEKMLAAAPDARLKAISSGVRFPRLRSSVFLAAAAGAMLPAAIAFVSVPGSQSPDPLVFEASSSRLLARTFDRLPEATQISVADGQALDTQLSTCANIPSRAASLRGSERIAATSR